MIQRNCTRGVFYSKGRSNQTPAIEDLALTLYTSKYRDAPENVETSQSSHLFHVTLLQNCLLSALTIEHRAYPHNHPRTFYDMT